MTEKSKHSYTHRKTQNPQKLCSTLMGMRALYAGFSGYRERVRKLRWRNKIRKSQSDKCIFQFEQIHLAIQTNPSYNPVTRERVAVDHAVMK